MAFEPGHKHSRGRLPGAINRRTAEAIAILEKHNFCPISALIECYQEAKKTYDNYSTVYEAICDAGKQKGKNFEAPEDNAHRYLKIASDTAKDLAGYAFPKLKAIEQLPNKPTEGMTPLQKLEAARAMVQILESQVRADGTGTP